MSHFVRQSKYRHVFCEAPKAEECYTNFRLCTATGEQNFIKGNTRNFCISVDGGGGPFAVVPYERKGRYDVQNTTLVNGHSAAVNDFDWNPFHEQIVASASEDTTIKVWGIPDDGAGKTLTEPLVELRGHGRKATLLRFHPTASNILASTGGDFVSKLWDIEQGRELHSLNDVHHELIQDIVWDYNGSTYSTTCKDRAVRMVDARQNSIAQTIEVAHDGTKSCKMTYLGNSDRLITVGFTKQSQRQIKMWDRRSLAEPLKALDVDQQAGALIPFYDIDAKLLFLAGKGDGNIRYYEIVDEAPFCFFISEYRSTVAQKGAGLVPKRGMDVMRCETTKILKLTTNAVEPLSFIVPRKSDAFQDDLFPPTYAGQAALTSAEWLSGQNRDPVLMSLAPTSTRPAAASTGMSAFKSSGSSGAAGAGHAAAGASSSSGGSLQSQLDAARARIAVLEKRLADAGLDSA